MRPRLVLAVLACAATLAAACASSPPVAPDATGAADLAPFPYTAAQIRDATPAGRTYVFRMAQGDEVVLRTIRFMAVDAEGAETLATLADLTGAPVAEPARQRVSWDELRQHASYPRATTTLSDATVTVPAGTFACRRYVVQIGSDEQIVVDFAHDLPGAPVSLVDVKAGAEVLRMTLERHEVAAATP